MKKSRFLMTFLLVFGLLLVSWRKLDGARWYTKALLACAAATGPMIHGWVLETPPSRRVPTWVHGDDEVQASIQFDALAVGVVPVLALLAATPGMRWRRRAGLMAIGAALCFAVDTAIVALFPLLVFYKNPFTDIVGTFLGVVVFVGAPVIIWFLLTFRELQQWLPMLRPRTR